MTREEAIRILDPETFVEELLKIEYYGGFAGWTKAAQAVYDACMLAVAALREQEERSKPKEEQQKKPMTNVPTVDAVEVVRCRDCAKDGLFTCPICFIENKELYFINHSPDFYCGEGERKGGDGNG